MLSVVAVDPGITSGVAFVRFVEDIPSIHVVVMNQIQHTPGSRNLIVRVSDYFKEAEGFRVLVIEDFILPHRVHGPKEAKATLKVIGALEGFAEWSRAIRVEYVTPPETKAFPLSRVCEVTGKTPKHMRKYPHAADAVRVALAYWSKQQRRK